ncbi:hypothetical protein PtB15_17B314 [Puccinia triticina]|nr:hypothetical protein PtB15_17B314 [Puccinia triticina]
MANPHNELVDPKALKPEKMIGVFDQDRNKRPFGGIFQHEACVVFFRSSPSLIPVPKTQGCYITQSLIIYW